MVNLDKYSADELKELKKEIDKALTQRRKDEEKEAREEMRRVAERYGFSVDELVGKQSAGASKTPRRKTPAKFVHPDDPNKTWSGKGRKPQWVKEWEAAGRSLDDARVAG